MGFYILIFELFMIVFFGIFVRTGTTTLSTFTDLEGPLYFTLAFTLLHLKHRMYDWSQLTNLLFVAALAFQMNTLFFMFWEASFYQTFNSTVEISSIHLIINIECTLAILVTLFQFTGRFSIQQVFALSMVAIFAFALNFSINLLGIKAISAGGTMNVFLFGYIFALPIKKLVCEQELQASQSQGQRYFTLTLKFIGLMGCIMLWPSFSYSTALVDQYYLITSIAQLSSTANLSAQAFLQMIIGFCAAIGITLGLRVVGEKINLEKYINSLLMTGIFLSSSSSVIIDPFASLLMGALVPILSFVIERFLSSILIKGYPVQAIIFCLLGGIFDAIFTGGRSNRTPVLCINPATQGGLQFLSVLITAVMAFVFGLLAAVILRCFNPPQSVNKDWMTWFIDQENIPIYPDDPILKKITGDNIRNLKQEGANFDLKNSFLEGKDNGDMGKIIKQVVEQSRIN